MVFSIPKILLLYIVEAPSKAAANFFYLTIYKAQKSELKQSGAFRTVDWATTQEISKSKLQYTVGKFSFIDEVKSIYVKSSKESVKVFDKFDYGRGVLSYRYTDRFFCLMQIGFRDITQGNTIKGSWFREGEELKKFLDLPIHSKYIYSLLNVYKKEPYKAKLNIEAKLFFETLDIDLKKAPSDINRDIQKKLGIIIKNTGVKYGLQVVVNADRVFIGATGQKDIVYTSGIDKRTYNNEYRQRQAAYYRKDEEAFILFPDQEPLFEE